MTFFVTLHPYFTVHPGQLPAALALLPQFVEKTATETGVLSYEFTRNGDEIYCREGYMNAEATLAHLQNVGPLLEQMLKHCALARLEIHGPAEELEKLRAPLAELKPAWFTRECGLER